ncbi:nucleotide exchange factor GrpE [Nocardia sp. NPDC005978]|uniref:nucleotide exchange factor GrpE n=1 Tax=Nocardia sp. NPDC005978 TaxID=3156725 RepID=UPI0033B5A860
MTEPAAVTGNSDSATEPTTDQFPVQLPVDLAPPAAPIEPAGIEPAVASINERVDDLARVIARQAGTIERLADDAKARDRRERAGADVPLLVELFALHGDARTCAATAESDTERAAFDAFAARVERLVAGRGGRIVEPASGTAFDALTMEAMDVTAAVTATEDRTVAAVIEPGLAVADRLLRTAKVVVRRYREPEA